MVNEWQSNWAEQIPFVQFAMNSAVSSSSGDSPFNLTRLQPPLTIQPWAKAPTPDSDASEVLEAAKMRSLKARDAVTKARLTQTEQANKRRRPEQEGEA
ncbi:hypothetical protein T439DRAFT_294846, partial [Meredithblackwellia eburnea MCA 4105]